MNLAYNADTVFTNLYLVAGHGSQCPIIAKLGVDCLQIATVSSVTAEVRDNH
jgi:neurofibromin 1